MFILVVSPACAEASTGKVWRAFNNESVFDICPKMSEPQIKLINVINVIFVKFFISDNCFIR